MKKMFISADIEGTAGIVNWDETEKSKADYGYFAAQMTAEVAAAAQGANAAGFGYVLVKDAHDSARNIDPGKLPEYCDIFRGWTGDPFCMMAGLDGSFEGVVFTGYHSGGGSNTNPLSHTMDTSLRAIYLNGERCCELWINSLTAAYVGVPVFAVSGDKGLCEWMGTKNPNIRTVAVSEGRGAGSLSVHPAVAARRIQQAVEQGASQAPSACMFPMPNRFRLEISYIKHTAAFRNSFYPGAAQIGPNTVAFETDDWYEALRFMHFTD